MTIELSKNVIDAIADAVVVKMKEPKTGQRLCRTCIYGDKTEYDKPCIIYSDNCQLYRADDVLDKIRAKIKALPTDYYGGYVGLDKQEILRIIDKYKADKKPTCGDCKEWGTVNCTETYREPTESDDVCDSFKAESERREKEKIDNLY